MSNFPVHSFLIASDCVKLFKMMASAFEHRSSRTLHAVCGEQMIEILLDRWVDAVIAEEHLLRSHGFDLLANVRAISPAVPVFVLAKAQGASLGGHREILLEVPNTFEDVERLAGRILADLKRS